MNNLDCGSWACCLTHMTMKKMKPQVGGVEDDFGYAIRIEGCTMEDD